MDVINGMFESCGALFILPSILRLHRDKDVKGVSVVHAAFFTSWGLWNLVYYPSLGQWLSFTGGIALASMNVVWLMQLVYYSQRGNDVRES